MGYQKAFASCPKVLGVHQLNTEYIWSCKPRLHDNLGLTDVRQKIASQHQSTGKHAFFHQSSLCTPFCFFLWTFPPISGLFLQDDMSPNNHKEGRKHMSKTRALRWLLEFGHQLCHQYLSKLPHNAKLHRFLGWLRAMPSALWPKFRVIVSHSRWWSYTRDGSYCLLCIHTRARKVTNTQGELCGESCGSHDKVSQLTVPVQLQNLLVLKWWRSHALSGGDRK